MLISILRTGQLLGTKLALNTWSTATSPSSRSTP